jgi:hypothetical protein
MPPIDPESLKLVRTAVEIAQQCKGYRVWKESGFAVFARDFTFTMSEANKIFDSFVMHPQNESEIHVHIETRTGYEDPQYFDFIAPTIQGQAYFEFVLACRDPEDPMVLIVNAHPPSFRRKT